MKMDRAAEYEYRRLVAAGMPPRKAKAFVWLDQKTRERLRPKSPPAGKRVWERASVLQREAEERGEVLARADALRMARKELA